MRRKINMDLPQIQSLINKLIRQHKRVINHEQNDYTNGEQLLEEIIVYYESCIETIQQQTKNCFKQFHENIMKEHQSQQHLSSLEAQFKAAFMRFSERKDKIVKEKSHISRKYDMLLTEFKKTREELTKQKEQNENLKQQLEKLKGDIKSLKQKDEQNLKLLEKYRNQNQNLKDQLQINLKDFKDIKIFLKQHQQAMKSSENYYKQTLKKLTDGFCLVTKRIMDQKQNQFEIQRSKMNFDITKYKNWFQVLIDDISYLIHYKKTGEVDYETWMQRYLELEMRDRVFQKDSKKAEHRQGILKHNIIGSDYDFIIDQEERYKQLMQKIQRYQID